MMTATPSVRSLGSPPQWREKKLLQSHSGICYLSSLIKSPTEQSAPSSMWSSVPVSMHWWLGTTTRAKGSSLPITIWLPFCRLIEKSAFFSALTTYLPDRPRGSLLILPRPRVPPCLCEKPAGVAAAKRGKPFSVSSLAFSQAMPPQRHQQSHHQRQDKMV